MDLRTFNLADIRKEIRRELEMRRNVWQTVPGLPERFVSMEHQRKYDILKQLSEVLEHAHENQFHSLTESAISRRFNSLKNTSSPDLFTKP